MDVRVLRVPARPRLRRRAEGVVRSRADAERGDGRGVRVRASPGRASAVPRGGRRRRRRADLDLRRGSPPRRRHALAVQRALSRGRPRRRPRARGLLRARVV